MTGASHRSTRPREPGIGLAPIQWIWLVGNLVWLHTLVPGVILAVASQFRDPATGALERIGAAAVLIAGIPFVLVVGFAVASWGVLERVAGRPAAVVRGTEREADHG